MPKVTDIQVALEQFAPPFMKMEWDNIGLLCGHLQNDIHKVLVALDPFYDVCVEAFEKNADLLVTHHPLIFQPVKALNDADSTGKSILFLAEHGIAAINAHTNLDQSPGGVNDCLARQLGLKDISVLSPCGVTEAGEDWGLLRIGNVQTQTFMDFAENVKAELNAKALRCVSSGKNVKRVAVGGGACGSCLYEVARSGADTFVTSDLKYNQFQDAMDLGLNVIDAGHFETEWPVVEKIADVIRCAFPNLEVCISEVNRNPLFFV